MNTVENTEVGSNTNIPPNMCRTITSDSKRIRAFMITINNFSEEERGIMMSLIHGKEQTRYIIYQIECGEKNVFHIQGFFYCKNAMTFGALKRQLPRAHIEEARNIKACIKYCSKTETRVDGPWELGTMPEQGRRTDLEEAAREFLTKSEYEFAMENPDKYVRYHKGLKALKTITQQHRNTPPRTIWLWGLAGKGKTRTAYEAHSSAYIKDGTMWWDQYENEEAIIIDDFDGRWPFRDLLRLLDRYPYQGQIKGGYVKITSPVIYITCEHPPEHFWKGNELEQIRRRLTEVRLIGPQPEEPTAPTPISVADIMAGLQI